MPSLPGVIKSVMKGMKAVKTSQIVTATRMASNAVEQMETPGLWLSVRYVTDVLTALRVRMSETVR